MTALLETRALTRRFGGITAVKSLDLRVNEGELLVGHRPERRRQDHTVQPDHRA